MPKQFVKLLLVFTLCTSLLIGLTDSIKAQSILSSKTTASEQKFTSLQSDPNVVTWEMLGLGESNLDGPHDSVFFSFRLPADWKLIEGASLNLSLGVSVNTGILDQSNSEITEQGQPYPNGAVGAGTLTVTVNDTTLLNLPLDEVGEVARTISIPTNALILASDDGFINVEITLNSGTSCYNFDQMKVVIRTSSHFILPHESIQPSTSLINFPRPIYQDSFMSDSALLVIPDQPSAAELQAALTVSSGFGKLSGGSLIFDMVTLDKLTTEQKTENHLIFVGTAASLPVLKQLQLPLPVNGAQFQVSGGNTDDGFVEMINSPWNDANVILIVSGNTDQGTIKAAQAVSSGVFQPSQFPNLAVVQEVQTTPVLTPQPTDQTLTALGYKSRLFENRGVSNVSYNFNVPPGWTVGQDSSFELVFGHSALLDYSSSGIVVLLNNKPIGSVRMSDASAGLSTNKVLINIPTSAIVPGKNRLDVRVNLEPQDVCSPQNMRGLWVNIWPESTLHLPLAPTLIDPSSSLTLSSYPAPFIYYPLLDNMAFILMHDDVESWRDAATIAAFLGSIANGPVTALKVYYADSLPEAERAKYNLLIIGRPSQMPIMGEINKTLPVPFLDGIDVIADANLQVTYRIQPDSPMGFMEIMPSPWNSENVILAIVGNTAQGVRWATTSLIDPALRFRLGGNFAVINDKQIITTDTRLTPTIASDPTPVAEVPVVPSSMETTPQAKGQQPAWVVAVFILSIILIILIFAFVIVGGWLRHRTRGSVQIGDSQLDSQGYFNSIKKRLAVFFAKARNRRKDKS